MSEDPDTPFRAGFVTVVGRPNAGKSTLVNRLVGQKVAIVSDKPQTTRNRILAVCNRPHAQLVLFDTPGLHKPMHAMNRRMVETATRSIALGDVVLWLADVSEGLGPGDRWVADLLKKVTKPVILGLNKVDLVPDKKRLLPMLERYSTLMEFAEIVPLSAQKGDNVDRLLDLLIARLPAAEKLYPDDFLTDLPERFFVSEMIRERILKKTRDEIPYTTGVVIESFKEEAELVRIEATIVVERENQKGILIGKGGAMLKAIGTEARQDIEAFLGARVYLGLFVKVRENWRESPSVLQEMGLAGREGE